MNVTNPPDRVPEGKFPFLQNVRGYAHGEIGPRPGLVKVNSSPLADSVVHTIKQVSGFNAISSNTTTETVLGAGTNLYSDEPGPGFTRIDTGYSGAPLATVAWRPSASPDPYLYVSDVNKARKVDLDGNVSTVGFAPPTVPPTAIIGQPNFNVIDPFASTTGWNTTGTAGSLTQGARFSTTIQYIMAYQTIAEGNWYAFTLASTPVTQQIAVGDVAVIASETTTIAAVYNQSGVSTTIQAITYDSGSTGACTIQPATPIVGLTAGTLLLIGSGPTAIVVSEVDEGPDGTGVQTFRCVDPSTHAASDAIDGTITLLAFCTSSHAASDAVVFNKFSFALTTGTGSIYKTESLNLAEVNSRAAQPSDLITLALNISTLADLTSLTVGFGLTSSSFSSSPNSNYLYATLTAGDLYPTTDGQWYVATVAVADLLPMGVTPGLSLTNVAQIGISATCSAGITVELGSFWIGGTYGPLVSGPGQPYEYVYTYESSVTGAESNPSGILRVPVSPVNTYVFLSGKMSADPDANMVNWYRRGGTLSTWNFIGTGSQASPGGTSTFADVFSDTYAEVQSQLDQTKIQPFPVQDVPATGTCNVIGTEVTWASGTQFNTAWAPGTFITIGGTVYVTYGAPSSATVLQLTQSAGISSGETFTIQQPTLVGQPLPSLWGPYQGVMFGCGDARNPGYLYWTNGNDPDSAGPANYAEVTSPAEPLINGCMYNGRAYLFSSARMFLITPNGALSNGTPNFQVQDIPNSKGLLTRTCLAVGPQIYFMGPDGIYASTGGAPNSITDADMRIAFPHEGNLGQNVQVAFSSGNYNDTIFASQLAVDKLAYANQFLYYDYLGTDNNYHTLAFDLTLGGWFYDQYALGPTIASAAVTHYAEEGSGAFQVLVGSNTGLLYTMDGTEDDGRLFNMVLDTPSWDLGSARSRKYYGDYGVRVANGNTYSVTTQPIFDLYTIYTPVATNTATANGENYFTNDINPQNAPPGQLAKNIAFRHAWTLNNGTILPSFYDMTYSYVPQPEDTYARAQYTSVLDAHTVKWVQGLRAEIDTLGVTKTFTVYADGAAATSFTINHNGQQETAVSWPPFICREVALFGDEGNLARVFSLNWVYDVLPSLGTNWTTEFTGFNIQGYKFLRWIRLRLMSTSVSTLTVNIDGQPLPGTFSIRSTGGADDKVYVALPPIKAMLWQFSVTNPQGVRLFMADTECMVKNVNGADFQIVQPWGGDSNQTGAKV